jgi:hypothetical protein
MLMQDTALSTQKLKKINRAQQSLNALKEQRHNLWKIFFASSPLVEGSFGEFLVRCGRSNCHCHAQPCHLLTRLSHWQEGKLKHKVVKVADRQWVKPLSQHYKEHTQALSQLLKVNKKEYQLLKNVMEFKVFAYK